MNVIRGKSWWKNKLVALMSGMGMGVGSAVNSWRCFRPLSSHWVTLYVLYVILCRILGSISSSATSCKYIIIGVMASMVSWEIIYVVSAAGRCVEEDIGFGGSVWSGSVGNY